MATTKKTTTKEKKIDTEKVEQKTVVVPEPVKPALAYVQPVDDTDDVVDELKIEREIAGKPDRYYQAIGKRKTAVARIRLFTRGEKVFLVNDKPYTEYFQLETDRQTAVSSMNKMKCLDKFKVQVLVRGGGRSAQAEAIRHGTARVLVDFNLNFKKRLRKAGFLTRDSRMRERKKFGLKRARKAPQWAKR